MTFYRRRMSRIFIPTLFWSGFFLLWVLLKGGVKGQPVEGAYLIKKLLSGRPHYHMWFLYMIVFLYLFTPFLKKVISNSSRFETATLVFFSLLISALNAIAARLGITESKLFINWFLMYIPYFLLGDFVRTSKANYSKSILWGTFSLSVLLTAIGCYVAVISFGLHIGLYFYDYLSITVIPMSMSIMYLLKLWTKPIGNERLTKKLASLTLGIYLIHPVFLETIQYALGGYHGLNPLISVPVLSVMVFVLSLGAAWAMSSIKYVNRVI